MENQKNTFVKKLIFPSEPYIFSYIQDEYNRTNTLSEMLELHSKWEKIHSLTKNKVKSEAYKLASQMLSNEITGISMEEKNVTELRNRVHICRDKLNELNIRSARFYFTRKYPEYQPKNDIEKHRIENLWFGKSTDLEFTEKLELFTKYKETEFK